MSKKDHPARRHETNRRLLALLYGAVAYCIFLATFLYAIAFVAGLGVPRHVDRGIVSPSPKALVIDLALLGLFAIALMTTGYILLAVKFLEERDLVAYYGDTYRDYQRRVPMLLPWPKRKRM